MAVVFGLLSALGFGTSDLIARFATRQIGTIRTIMYMQILGAVVLGVFLALSGEFARLASSTDWMHWAWGIGFALCNMLASLSLYRSFEVCGTMAIISPIGASYAAITALLAWFSGEQLLPTDALGIILTLVGIVLTAIHFTPGVQERFTTRGIGWALGAALGFGISYWVLGVFVTPVLGGVAPVWIARMTTLIILTTVGLLFSRKMIAVPPRSSWRFILGVGVLDTAGFLLYSEGTRTGEVAIVAVLTSLYSAVTVLLAWLLLHEQLQRIQWAGIGLILAGIVLVSL